MATSGIEGRERTYWGLESKTCDSCKTSPAILFCHADSAFLCCTCDARVHSANKLASRHERVWLCEVCEQAPAAVTCKADAAALCFTCDADIHSANTLARRHERLPVVPFFDPVSATAVKDHAHGHSGDGGHVHDAASMFLLKSNIDDEVDLKSVDYVFSDVDPYMDLDYADSVVPVQLTKTVVGAPPLLPPTIDFDLAARSNPSYSTYSVCSSEGGVVPDGIGDVSTGYKSGGNPTTTTSAMTVMDREARVMRYREKRKNRKFEKTIRYASRKAYAETRPRIKGRFAKRTEVETQVEWMYSSAAAAGIMVDGGYGVVPSF